MEVSELEIAIDELETRVERLRSLYEQYFMGIEKIPPAVAQKDVDRRIYVLRRTQIRNTAKRFKLQTIIQRYNTFQQYWMRILREIEHGTYRRHVLRAEKTVGIANLLTAAERKRLGLADPAAKGAIPEAEAQNAAPYAKVASNAPSSESLDSLAPPAELNPSAVRSQIERELGLSLDEDLDELPTIGRFGLARELDDPLLSSLPPAPRKRKPSLRANPRQTAPPASKQPSLTSGGAPPSSRRKSIRPDRVISIEPPPPDSADRVETQAMPPIALAPRPAARIPGAPPPRPAVPPEGAPLAPQKLRLPVQSAVAGRGLPPPQSAVAGRGLPPPPKRPDIPTTPNHSKVDDERRPETTKATRDATAPESRPKGLPDIRESVIPRPSRPNPAPRAEPTRPMFDRPSPPQVSESKDTGNTLDRTNMERLAKKLTEARQQTHEKSPVLVDALTKKLEATAAELQKKHVGRRIDFDVVIKDGKAIVKPIVR